MIQLLCCQKTKTKKKKQKQKTHYSNIFVNTMKLNFFYRLKKRPNLKLIIYEEICIRAREQSQKAVNFITNLDRVQSID